MSTYLIIDDLQCPTGIKSNWRRAFLLHTTTAQRKIRLGRHNNKKQGTWVKDTQTFLGVGVGDVRSVLWFFACLSKKICLLFLFSSQVASGQQRFFRNPWSYSYIDNPNICLSNPNDFGIIWRGIHEKTFGWIFNLKQCFHGEKVPVNGCTLLCNNVWIHAGPRKEFGNQWDILLKQVGKVRQEN